MNTELSAFYFDIRKDALYCEPYSSVKRRAALTVIDEIFKALVAWLAPILSFTAEEAWLAREPGREGSVHLETFPELDKAWRNDELARKWDLVRNVRRVVTGALELERAAKRIGSSLEAAPDVYVADRDMLRALEGVELEEVSITSGARSSPSRHPKAPSRCLTCRAWAWSRNAHEGRKCARSWRILTDIGADPAYPDLSPRDAAAVREFDQRANRNCMTTESSGVRTWLWGPYSRLGLTVFLITLVLDQAHKWWMLEVYRHRRKGSRRRHSLPRPRVREEHRHQLQHVRPGELRRAAHAGGLRGGGDYRPVDLARPRGHRPPLAVSLGLIMGGAIGNAIDRVALGGVADFFSLHAFGFYWYVFNIADVAIVAGVIGLLYDSLLASCKDAAKSL